MQVQPLPHARPRRSISSLWNNILSAGEDIVNDMGGVGQLVQDLVTGSFWR
jgi:hypothetical protein